MLKLALILAALLWGPEAARILCFYPFPGRSHHRLFGPLAAGLASRGHRLQYYAPIPLEEDLRHPNITEVLLPNLGQEVLGSIDFQSFGRQWIPHHLHLMYSKLRLLLSRVLAVKEVRDLIHSDESFDAVIMESYFFQEPLSAFIHKFRAVGIEFVPLGDFVWVNELTGLWSHSSYVTDYKTLLIDDLSFWDRLYNSLTTAGALATSYLNMRAGQELMDRHFDYPGWEERPRLSLLAANRSLVLVNRSPYLGVPYPTAPHVKEVGGINVRSARRPLPPDIQKFMDEAKHGVIYMSLGLNMEVSSILKGSIKTFLNVFSRLPQRVLLKWEASYSESLPQNIMIRSVMPQQEILGHEKCVLFITHGGVLSLFETAHYGVPVLGIPFYGDQPRNILWAQSVGIGIHLDQGNITEGSLSWAFGELLNNGRYRTEMEKRSRLLRNARRPPLDEAIYWIEQALDHPNALTPRAVYQSFWALHQIDVTLFLLAALGLLAYISAGFIAGRSRTTSRSKLKES